MTKKDAIFTSNKDDNRTPRQLFDELNKEFHFDLDPCTFEDNPLGTKHFFTKEIDELKQHWGFAKSIFINPPFKTIDIWVQKASESVASNPGQAQVTINKNRTSVEKLSKLRLPKVKSCLISCNDCSGVNVDTITERPRLVCGCFCHNHQAAKNESSQVISSLDC